jgi:hypothetical protein
MADSNHRSLRSLEAPQQSQQIKQCYNTEISRDTNHEELGCVYRFIIFSSEYIENRNPSGGYSTTPKVPSSSKKSAHLIQKSEILQTPIPFPFPRVCNQQ